MILLNGVFDIIYFSYWWVYICSGKRNILIEYFGFFGLLFVGFEGC